jgi:hypothetical protein
MVPLFANRWLIALPPIWLLGAGCLIAMLFAVGCWFVLRVLAPRAAAEARASLGDGFRWSGCSWRCRPRRLR